MDTYGDWAGRRHVLQQGFRDLRPDLVVFQEVIGTQDYDQASDVLGGEFHVSHQVGREADGSGASIASRWPIRDAREVDLT